MKIRFPLVMLLTALFLFVFVAPVSAQKIADGTYQVHYEMKEKSSDNTSIADGYFVSPATLKVENGVQTITLTVTGSNYIKSLSTPNGPVTILSEDEANKTRTVQFRVDGDLSQPLSMDMHITVPDLYDQVHTARAVFDVSSLPKADGTATTASGDDVENPKTGEDSSIVLYASLMLISLIALVAIWKFRPARN